MWKTFFSIIAYFILILNLAVDLKQ